MEFDEQKVIRFFVLCEELLECANNSYVEHESSEADEDYVRQCNERYVEIADELAADYGSKQTNVLRLRLGSRGVDVTVTMESVTMELVDQ